LIREQILDLIKMFYPPRLVIHSLYYLVYGGDGLDWRVTYTGLYSRRLARIIDQLIRSGQIKICPNDRLVPPDHECPNEEFNSIEIIEKAIKQYMIQETIKKTI